MTNKNEREHEYIHEALPPLVTDKGYPIGHGATSHSPRCWCMQKPETPTFPDWGREDD